ncbi:MAG TPA: four helix bundle protein [Lacibacter sp.]|nr:four helix bundle protein [Lacibacter sp.]HMO89781.1 four helix bundle protein [Lacibacter sp.]HMP88221.1 four helix bundle protein [Lacibacter sp.]
MVDKTLSFALDTIEFIEILENERKYVIARQLLRSATAIGASVFEAQQAESRSDFIHKMKIAAKEAHETLYSLLLCEQSKHYPTDKRLLLQNEEIIKIISKIISSAKGRIPGFIWTIIFAFTHLHIFKFSH